MQHVQILIIHSYLLCRFTKHDAIAVCLAIFLPMTATILTMVSILPALGASPLPDFSNPVKVWYLTETGLLIRSLTLALCTWWPFRLEEIGP